MLIKDLARVPVRYNRIHSFVGRMVLNADLAGLLHSNW